MQPLETRPDPGKWKAVTLTVLVHVLLVAALIVGFRWQNQPPEAVEVELWQAPPPPPPPPVVEAERKPMPEPEPQKAEPPPPPKPDIVVKKEKPEPKIPKAKEPEPKKPEAKKPEAKKPEPPRPSFDAALKQELAQVDRDKAVREKQLRAEQEARALQQAQADRTTAAHAKGLADYVGKIKGKIRGNVVLPPSIAGNPETIFEIVQLPSGEVLSVRLKKSSGNAGLDAAIERAILKSSPLPKAPQPELFQRVLELKYRPVEE